MSLGNLTQIIIYVQDMQKQVVFYRDILGLKVKHPLTDDYSKESWVAFDTGQTTFALHSGGKGRIGEDAPKFTFEVDNVQEIKSTLIERGVEMGGIIEAYPGSFVCRGSDSENFGFFIQSHPKNRSKEGESKK